MDSTIKKFFHLLWLGLLGVFFVIYLSFTSRFTWLGTIVQQTGPAVIFLAVAVLIVSRDRMVYRRRTAAGEASEIVYLTGLDALVHDALSFLTGAVVVAIPLATGGVNATDILQAVITVAALWYLRYHYFHKVNRGR